MQLVNVAFISGYEPSDCMVHAPVLETEIRVKSLVTGADREG